LSLNGAPLVNNVDYQILSDGVTIQISDKYLIVLGDGIEITYIANQTLSATVLGYRIFNDIFNRTSFKRVSAQNSTYLTQPLSVTDTTIYVNDASVLTPAIPSKKIPGVVIIAGERIEFFTMVNNTLGQLRRGTLGTSPKTYSDIYTEVIDQSPSQTIPFSENIYQQTLYTTSTTATYTILTTATTSTGDGITISLDTTIPAVDQIQVYYGGYLLNKVGTFYQDTTISYDSPEFKLFGSTSSQSLLPSTTLLNTAYIVTSTNQVWVYTNSLSTDAINGYTYTGLNYLPPEFSINTATQQITLNTLQGVGDNIKLVIIKKEFSDTALWNNGISLLASTTEAAKFIQAKPSMLPNSYYSGGDPDITIETGFVLTDQNNSPIEGL
jgi:hypothetical protein